MTERQKDDYVAQLVIDHSGSAPRAAVESVYGFDGYDALMSRPKWYRLVWARFVLAAGEKADRYAELGGKADPEEIRKRLIGMGAEHLNALDRLVDLEIAVVATEDLDAPPPLNALGPTQVADA